MKDKTRLQALALIVNCNKYIMDLATNGVIITNALKFVEKSRKKLTMSTEDKNDKESKEPDYDHN
ncbi:MAG: hypothetical protein ACR2IS_08475 [Nitrososphaeraceae archaeon]